MNQRPLCVTATMANFSVRWRFAAGIDTDSLSEQTKPGHQNPRCDGARRLHLLVDADDVDVIDEVKFGS